MEDSELTRKAIEELMREMDEYKGKGSIPTERKKNPLGRPNKLFLGRTISSMMTHNKRESDRNLQRCERKLKELDAKQRMQKFKKPGRYISIEAISSDSYDDEHINKTNRRIKKKSKKRKKVYRSSENLSSEISTSSETDSNKTRKSSVQRKMKDYENKRNEVPEEKEDNGDFCSEYNNESTVRYYIDPNITFAIMAYSQMNHMMQQQQFVQPEDKIEPAKSIEIPSDLSLSCCSSTESSLNITFHSSSAEEDENGILTFKLSSDDEHKSTHISQKINKKSKKRNNGKIFIDCDESDRESIYSHITLDSNDSESCAPKESEEICSLSVSCTDSDEIEVVQILCNTGDSLENDKNSKLFDGSKKSTLQNESE